MSKNEFYNIIVMNELIACDILQVCTCIFINRKSLLNILYKIVLFIYYHFMDACCVKEVGNEQ